MDAMRITRRLSLSALAAVAVALLVGAPAQAHTQLVGVDPGEGATVAVGDTVTLTFSSALLDLGAEASVTDSTGTANTASVDLSQANALIVTIPEVAGGDATLTWRVVAEDGHPIEGTIAYVVEAPPAPEPSEPSETPSASAIAEPVATEIPVSPSPSPSAEARDGDSNTGVSVALWVAIAVALAAALFGTTYLARRRAGSAGDVDDAGAGSSGNGRAADAQDGGHTDH